VYWCSRQYDQSIESLQKVIDMDPMFIGAYAVLGWSYICKSLHTEAIAAGRKAVELSKGAPTFLFGLAQAYAGVGRREEALKILQQLQELSPQQYVTPYGLARVYTALEDKEEAIRSLQAAYEEHAMWMIFLKTDPHLDPLRPDPRFQDLLRRMNFPKS
jgi:tetratricopeptide (TPR) repeat protein